MSGLDPAATAPTRVLLVDAVVWSAAFSPEAPLCNVHQWFARWLSNLPGVTLSRLRAEDITSPSVAAGFDGVILSGSPRDAWDEDPVNHRLMALARELHAQGRPLLGVCYGHQIMARALGGRVARHPGGLELGNTELTLTAAGVASPLFRGFPPVFDVLSSHADAVLELPRGAELLAGGTFTPIQAFCHGPRYLGVQFHPETDPEILRFLWTPRLAAWRSRVRFDLDQALAGFRPTPLAPSVLRNFVNHLIP